LVSVYRMGLSWDSVLKNAAIAIVVMVAVSGVLYFVLQVTGYNSYLLSINLIALILVLIVILVMWRILKKTRL
jgi:hypothetical protein